MHSICRAAMPSQQQISKTRSRRIVPALTLIKSSFVMPSLYLPSISFTSLAVCARDERQDEQKTTKTKTNNPRTPNAPDFSLRTATSASKHAHAHAHATHNSIAVGCRAVGQRTSNGVRARRNSSMSRSVCQVAPRFANRRVLRSQSTTSSITHREQAPRERISVARHARRRERTTERTKIKQAKSTKVSRAPPHSTLEQSSRTRTTPHKQRCAPPPTPLRINARNAPRARSANGMSCARERDVEQDVTSTQHAAHARTHLPLHFRLPSAEHSEAFRNVLIGGLRCNGE